MPNKQTNKCGTEMLKGQRKPALSSKNNPLSYFAFSLAEMMIVILFVSIIMAMTVPIITKRTKVTPSTSTSSIPTGVIVAWHGGTLPSGWILCDGTNGTPDLRNRFIYGSTTATSTGTVTGGEATHILTTAEIPSHDHGGITSTIAAHTHVQNAAGSWPGGGSVGYYVLREGFNTTMAPSATGHSTSSGGSHSHTITATGSGAAHNTMPPYVVLAYIMKT